MRDHAQVTSERKSLLPLRLRAPCPVAPHPTQSMPSVSDNNAKVSLTVGSRVLVNGLKSGTLRYIGTVKFATGLFCGVELDQPEGKHDGQIKDVRYFQCPPNHGIFVPRDKVVLASRPRILSTQKPISRLRAPTMTRSVTLSSSINRIEQARSIDLPDILMNTTPQPVTSNDLIVNDPQEVMISRESPKQPTTDIIESIRVVQPPLPIDEQTIEADFTDSVSLILHQLQQEQNTNVNSSSILASEEGTDEGEDTDDDDDDDDGDDDGGGGGEEEGEGGDGVESQGVVEAATDEAVHVISDSSPLSPSSVFIPNDSSPIIQISSTENSKDTAPCTKVEIKNKQKLTSTLSSSVNKSDIKKKNDDTNSNRRKPNMVQTANKNMESRPGLPSVNTSKRLISSAIPRNSSIVPPKKPSSSRTKLNPAPSTTSLSSRSKLSLSLSSCNSLNSSQVDLTSTKKNSSAKQTPDIHTKASQPISTVSASSEKQIDESLNQLNTLSQQLINQKNLNRNLEINNQCLNKHYQELLDRFHLMFILSQYFINENDQIKKQHELQRSQAQTTKHQLQTSIDQLQLSHRSELSLLDIRHRSQIEILNRNHEQQLNEYQQKINQLCSERNELESRCSLLQEKVDGFLAEMANSEHADVLLCHVETLEKDRASLQTVLEIKTKEITQLRTKLNELEIQLDDEKALRKRVDMAENQNQSLQYLLRQKKANEKAVIAERDELKEQVAQLVRERRHLAFENESLRYRLRERPSSASSSSSTNKIIFPAESRTISYRKRQGRNRTCSLSSVFQNAHKNERISRSLSLNCILNR